MFTFPVCKHPVEYRWFRYRLYIFTDISIAISNTIWGYLKFHSAKRREAAHHQHGTNQESNATCACFQNEQRSIWTSFSCGCKLLHDIFGGSGSHLMANSHCTGPLLWAFCPKILGDGGDLWMVLCHSMDEGWVVEALKPYLLWSNLFEPYALTSSGDTKTSARARATLWNLDTYFLLFFISSYMKGRSYYVFLCSQWIIGGWLLSLSFSEYCRCHWYSIKCSTKIATHCVSSGNYQKRDGLCQGN